NHFGPRFDTGEQGRRAGAAVDRKKMSPLVGAERRDQLAVGRDSVRPVREIGPLGAHRAGLATAEVERVDAPSLSLFGAREQDSLAVGTERRGPREVGPS